MAAFTHVGDGPIQILTIAALYWTWDRQIAIRLAVLLTATGTLNGVLKQAFAMPRPSWIDPTLATTSHPSGFGMPSGHAQSSTTWLLIPMNKRVRWLWVITVVYVISIGYSRVVTGVHTWEQVLMGWAVGLAFLAAFMWTERRARRTMPQGSPITILLILAAVVIGTISLAADTIDRIPTDVAETWRQYARTNGLTGAGPIGLRHVVAPLGCLTGFVVGAMLDARLPWDRARSFGNGLLRIAVGTGLTGGVYVIARSSLPIKGEDTLSLCLRFVVATTMALTAFYVAPMVLRRMGLMAGDEADGVSPSSETAPS